MLTGGKATLSVSSLSADTHLINATYGGDANNKSITSANLTQTVKKLSPSVTLTFSPNPYTTGQSLTLVASVSPSDATGSVMFSHSGPSGTYGDITCATTARVNNGQATCVTSNIPGGLGVSSITALYSGDVNYSSATSPAVSVTIRQQSVLQLTSSANPALSENSTECRFSCGLPEGDEFSPGGGHALGL
jgi:hypothetical protein